MSSLNGPSATLSNISNTVRKDLLSLLILTLGRPKLSSMRISDDEIILQWQSPPVSRTDSSIDPSGVRRDSKHYMTVTTRVPKLFLFPDDDATKQSDATRGDLQCKGARAVLKDIRSELLRLSQIDSTKASQASLQVSCADSEYPSQCFRTWSVSLNYPFDTRQHGRKPSFKLNIHAGVTCIPKGEPEQYHLALDERASKYCGCIDDYVRNLFFPRPEEDKTFILNLERLPSDELCATIDIQETRYVKRVGAGLKDEAWECSLITTASFFITIPPPADTDKFADLTVIAPLRSEHMAPLLGSLESAGGLPVRPNEASIHLNPGREGTSTFGSSIWKGEITLPVEFVGAGWKEKQYTTKNLSVKFQLDINAMRPGSVL